MRRTFSVNVNLPLDRYAVAHEVMASTIRVLLAAGFNKDEVADLLEQSIEQWRSGQATTDKENVRPSQIEERSDDDAETNLYEIEQSYDQLNARRALIRLEKRADKLHDMRDASVREKAFAILSEAMPVFADAQRWLIERGEEAGLSVIPRRDAWIETASDDELDAEDNFLFLDDHRWSGNFPDWLCGRLIDTLLNEAKFDDLQRVTDVMSESGVITLGDNTQRAVDSVAESLPVYVRFLQYVQGSASGEYMQSDFIDGYYRINPDDRPHSVQGWMQSFEDSGQVTRFKKGNRWRVAI